MKSLDDLKQEGIDLKIESTALIDDSLLRKQIEYICALNPFNIDFLSSLFIGKLSSLLAKVQEDEICGCDEAILHFQNKEATVPFCDFHIARFDEELNLGLQVREAVQHIYNKSLRIFKNFVKGKVDHSRYELSRIDVDEITEVSKSNGRIVGKCSGKGYLKKVNCGSFDSLRDYWGSVVIPLVREDNIDYGLLVNEICGFKDQLTKLTNSKDKEAFYFYNYLYANISNLHIMVIEHKPESAMREYNNVNLSDRGQTNAKLYDLHNLLFLNYRRKPKFAQEIEVPFESKIQLSS
jgi:hypothetical protein